MIMCPALSTNDGHENRNIPRLFRSKNSNLFFIHCVILESERFKGSNSGITDIVSYS